MTILLDACVPRKFERLIQSWGYPVLLSGTELRPDAPDSQVIQQSQLLDSVPVTIDMDFSNILDYPPENYGGIVVLRYDVEHEESLIETLREALQTLYRDQLRHALVIVTAGRYRVRRPAT
jgi:predicted nuclease of predicted toxin-antitoxin system